MKAALIIALLAMAGCAPQPEGWLSSTVEYEVLK